MHGSARHVLRTARIVGALVSLLLMTSGVTLRQPASLWHASAVRPRTRRTTGDVCGDVGDLTTGRETVAVPCAPTGSSKGVAKGDFNGDGIADLAVGVPGADSHFGNAVRARDAGAVIVIYGSASGLTATDPSVPASQLWNADSVGIPGVSQRGAGFGSALASGDFNGDGFSDLAIGVPNEVVVLGDLETMGRVVLIYGSAQGLSTDAGLGIPAPSSFSFLEIADPDQLVVLFVKGSIVESGFGDHFGAALAWGDFNGDGIGDLAVGAPKALITRHPGDTGDPLAPEAGAVGVLFGSSGGLSSIHTQLFCERNLFGASSDGALFGQALAGGDFDGNGIDDLAVGVPGNDPGPVADAGGVYVVPGTGSGLTKNGSRFLGRDIPGIIDFAGAGDRFGWSLATGDFNGDGRDDLAVGVPFDDIGSASSAGSVHIFFGSSGGITTSGNTILTQGLIFGDNSDVETGNAFGFALAAADFNGDGRADLAIGVPFQDFFNDPDCGEVDVIYGASSGLSGTAGPGSQSWHQSFAGITTLISDAESHDQFGQTLTAWNFGRDFHSSRGTIKTADLAVGVPFEDVFSHLDHITPEVNAGAVNVIYGSSNGLTVANNQFWYEDSEGVPGDAESGDFFGMAAY